MWHSEERTQFCLLFVVLLASCLAFFGIDLCENEAQLLSCMMLDTRLFYLKFLGQ